jgi:hypothetical protein
MENFLGVISLTSLKNEGEGEGREVAHSTSKHFLGLPVTKF